MLDNLALCLNGIESSKITERAKHLNDLEGYLNNKQLLNALHKNTHPRITWNKVVDSLHNHLHKEAEKLAEDQKKKKSFTNKKAGCDILFDAVRLANKEVIRLDISALLRHVIDCFSNNNFRQYFGETYLIILKDHILPQDKCVCEIESQDWLSILSLLKALYNKEVMDQNKILICVLLIIQKGPLHKMPTINLREEFPFITKVCNQLNPSKPKIFLETVLKIYLEFNEKVASDCCMACCKLSEDVIEKMQDLMGTSFLDSNLKVLLLKCFHLQIRLHHPKGALKNSSTAYACQWVEWSKKLIYLYELLCREINENLRVQSRQTLLFGTEAGKRKLHDCFVALLVDVFHQVYSITRNDNLNRSPDEIQPASKRRKIEEGISSIITSIQESKDWPWIHVMTEVLNRYPTLITPADFLKLLQILSTLQSETKNLDIRRHVQRCLATLIDVQTYLKRSDVVSADSYWSIIWETTLRSAGLNQNQAETHKLLQKLISEYKVTQFNSLYKMYLSGVLTVSVHSLLTLHFACAFNNLPDEMNVPNTTTNSTRKNILRWLFAIDSDKIPEKDIYSHNITGQIMVFSTLKEWPYMSLKKNAGTTDDFSKFENVYVLNAFEGLISIQKKEKAIKPDISALLDEVIFTELVKYLEEHCNELIGKQEATTNFLHMALNTAVLINNILSVMLHYGLIQPTGLDDVEITKIFKKLLEVIWDTICSIKEVLTYKMYPPLQESFKLLRELFSNQIDIHLSKKVRTLVNIDVIRSLFYILKLDDEIDEDDYPQHKMNPLFKLKETSLRILLDYVFVNSEGTFTGTQHHVLEALAVPSYEPSIDKDYQLAMVFLKSLKNCKPGLIPDKILQMILEIIQKICEVCYNYYNSAMDILTVLKYFYKHIALCDSINFKESAALLLYPFFENACNYGPEVAVTLINCMGTIAELDPERIWSNWSDDRSISSQISSFINNDNQEVRLTAVKNVIKLFSTSNIGIQQCTFQKEVFSLICKKCNDVFIIQGNLSREREIDESVTRIATVMHTFASIMITSTIWRPYALFSLLKVAHEKKFNAESVEKVIGSISSKLGFKSKEPMMKIYVPFLIKEWHNKIGNLHDFPYQLLGCDEVMEFFKAYLDDIVPLLIQHQGTKDILELCNYVNRPSSDVIKETYPKIIAVVAKSLDASGNINGNVAYCNMLKLIDGINLNDLLTQKVDKVIVNLLRLISDMNHFKKQFEVNYILPELDDNSFGVTDFKQILNFLEKNMVGTSSLIKMCVYSCPSKVQQILLHLSMDIYNANGLEGKVIAFHRYTIFIDALIPTFNLIENNLREYLLRDIIYKLINIINEDYQNYTVFNIIATKYLKTLLQKSLPGCASVLMKYIIVVVGTLVPIAKTENTIGNDCLDVLNFIIIQNLEHFRTVIKTLDPFPSDDHFNEIQKLYQDVKYEDTGYTLKQEIEHFLNTGNLLKNVGNRLEGLKHLKNELSLRKNELKEMYEELKSLRGFSEDCEKSVIHQLIYMLVKLTSSKYIDVSLEATRCLGELGAADLTTIILHIENNFTMPDRSPFQIATGIIISLLMECTVDPNMDVVNAASSALYSVLHCKEGVNAADLGENYGYGKIDKPLLLPFLPDENFRNDTSIRIDKPVSQLFESNIWLSEPSGSHELWITNLVSQLLQIFSNNCYFSKLIPVCQVNVSFSEKILPLVIYQILATPNNFGTVINGICEQMRNFFDKHWQLIVCDDNSVKNEIVLKKASVQCMLDVVQYTRLQNNRNSSKIKVAELCLDYLKVAQAAQFCSAHFTTLLYAELWCQAKLDNLPRSDKDHTVSALDLICQSVDVGTTHRLQHIIRKAYTEVGDMDAIHGCGSAYLLDPINRINHYKQMEKWDNVILYYDLQMSHGVHTAKPQLMEAMKSLSLYQSVLQFDNASSEDQYECAWRLCNWKLNLPKNKIIQASALSFEKYRYAALKCLHNNDVVRFNNAITNARNSVIDSLRHVSLESSKNLYKTLSQVQALQEIEDFASAKTAGSFDYVISKWNIQDSINVNEFGYFEPIKSQRITMMRDMFMLGHTNLKEHLVNLYLDLAEKARLEGFYNKAMRLISSIAYLDNAGANTDGNIIFEEVQVLWATDKNTARYMLRNLINENSEKKNGIYAASLKLYGIWMAETRSENAKTIIADYFLESLQIHKKLERSVKNFAEMADAYDVIARFADKEYQRFVTYIKSSEFETKVKNMEKLRQSASAIKRRSASTSDEKRAIIISEGQSAIDETEIENTYKERNVFLNLAFKYYFSNLEHFDKNNVRVFRILSLWLENRSNTKISEIVDEKLLSIPSYKFIPILPQLVPHITNNEDDLFGQKIVQLVERCAKDHPHHTLPILMAIVNSNKDEEYCGTTKKNQSKEPRVIGSVNLLNKLKKDNSMREIIESMDSLCNALIELAYLKDENCTKVSKSKTDYTIPTKLKIRKVRNVANLPVPTITVPIEVNCTYSHIIGIHSFSHTFSNVGGINAPKRITCRGTDGITRTQLIKGKDDLRQDAVMQQVFNIMNDLLKANKQTTKLTIRTYKIVPLSKRSGILEWVENTMPLGDYLYKAHETYHPKDKKPDHCRNELRKAAKSSLEEKLEIYNRICQSLRPVFHKFFEENFPQPGIWYERRRAYMHSVATSSMCGYILGLGDRHVQNILIDKSTAEVVHIDFGIAFEQGLLLPTPETVPFRLTRDIEAGMGVSGVQGVFQRACEKSMDVLRQNGETIITILEVLLYDPLYVWTITPEQAYNHQRDRGDMSCRNMQEFLLSEETNVNVTAERALLRLRSKLMGTEEGGASSVEGQVQKLIQQAHDPSNLCKLFHGWQPYF